MNSGLFCLIFINLNSFQVIQGKSDLFFFTLVGSCIDLSIGLLLFQIVSVACECFGSVAQGNDGSGTFNNGKE